MARMWRDNSGIPETVHKFKINTDEIYSLFGDYKTLLKRWSCDSKWALTLERQFISVFSLDFVSFRYILFSYFTDFVVSFRWNSFSYFTDFVSFRWISFSYFTDFVGFCFRFVSFRFSVYRYPLACLSVTVLLTCITRNSIQAGFACRQTFRSSNVIFLFVLSVCQYLWIIKFPEWAYRKQKGVIWGCIFIDWDIEGSFFVWFYYVFRLYST